MAAMHGIAVAALGMLSTIATGLAIDAYGPISDNASASPQATQQPVIPLESIGLPDGGVPPQAMGQAADLPQSMSQATVPPQSASLLGCEKRVVTIYSSRCMMGLLPVSCLLTRNLKRHIKSMFRCLCLPIQIGCVIGKGGQVIQNIHSETHAQIHILKDEHLPPWTFSSDEFL